MTRTGNLSWSRTVAVCFADVVSMAPSPSQIARGRTRLTKQVMLVCLGLVAQARSRLDSFRKITPPALAKVHSGPLRTWFAEPFTNPAHAGTYGACP